MLFYCTALFIIVPLYFGDFAECSSGSRGLGWGVAQAELCQLSPCTTALHAQLWCPKRQLWGDKDLETPSSPPDPEASPLPAQLILGPFSSFVFRVLTTKEMANELKLEDLFPGEVSCSQSPPAETAVGRSHLAAGPALHPGHCRPHCQCHETHHQLPLRAASLQPRGHWPPQTVDQLCPSSPEMFLSQQLLWNPVFLCRQSPQIFPRFLGLASNFSEFSRTLMTLQITEGKNSNLHLDISPFFHIPVTLGRERNWAQIFQDYAWASHPG